jgi:hypothetical protein
MTTHHDRSNASSMLLVGSMPYDSVDEVFTACATALGPYVPALPDGEVGDRRDWTNFLPIRVYSTHPDLDEVQRPPGGVMVQPDRESGPGGVAAAGEDETTIWTFRLRPGVTRLEFADIGYGTIAIESYRVFRRLRDEGVIPAGVRFQACFPGSSSAVDEFFAEPSEWVTAKRAYEDAVERELARMLDVIPADELAVQFDFCWEMMDLSIGDATLLPRWPSMTYAQKLDRHTASLDRLWRGVPDESLLGYHWCYGTWGGWPMTEMRDLALCVELSNQAVARCGRSVDYVHMPVVQHPDDSFFAPLDRLAIDGAKLYLGLIHASDDIEGFRRRLSLARRYREDFGIAGVCGYGRVDTTEVPHVLSMHRECAAALESMS